MDTTPIQYDIDELATPGQHTSRGKPYLSTRKITDTATNRISRDQISVSPSLARLGTRSKTSQLSLAARSQTGMQTPSIKKPRRPVPIKQSAPATPHGLRALQQRRAAVTSTPGRERRRSGKQQRETPRNILRKLSRVEAVATRNIDSLSSRDSKTTISGEVISQPEASYEEEARPLPTLSIPIDEDDDEDYSFDAPPRLSMEVDDTIRSIEAPRRYTGDLIRYGAGDMITSDQIPELLDRSFDEDLAYAAQFADRNRESNNILSDPNESDFRDLVQRSALDDQNGNEQSMLQLTLDDVDTTFAIDIPEHFVGSESRHFERSRHRLEGERRDLQEWSSPENKDMSSWHALSTGSKFSNVAKERAKSMRKVSRHALEYPRLPSSLLKALSRGLLRSSGTQKSRLSKEVIEAISLASDWYFEQASNDMGAYAAHAGRKTIEEADILTMMKRQRLVNPLATSFSLAQKCLPRELLQELKMPPFPSLKQKR